MNSGGWAFNLFSKSGLDDVGSVEADGWAKLQEVLSSDLRCVGI